MTKTVQAALDGLHEELTKVTRRVEIKGRILAALPGNLPAPTISNEDTQFFGAPGAWLSWRASYGDTMTGAEILAALEADGFAPLPVTVCKWDDYRATPEPGALEAIPETKGRYTLADATIVAPLWIEPNQHTGTEARAYYTKGGAVYKVTVSGPGGAFLTARRKKTGDSWYYEPGTASVTFPEAWHSLCVDDQPTLGISHLTRAYRDTEQGLSGAIYFELMRHEQTELPLTPAGILRLLEGR